MASRKRHRSPCEPYQSSLVSFSTLPQIDPSDENITLNLGSLRSEGCGSVAAALSHPETKVKHLHLYSNSLGDAECKVIAQSLKGNSMLRVLNLDRNLITSKGALDLATVLPSTALRELYLGDNQITDEGAVQLAQILHVSSLQVLDLHSNHLSNSGGQALLAAGTQIRLDLDRNKHMTASFYKEWQTSTAEIWWYSRALREGSARNNRVRIMMSGPFCVGKTSLLRRLKGQGFDGSYDTTKGIDSTVGSINKETVGSEFSFSQFLLRWRQDEETTRPAGIQFSAHDPATVVEDAKNLSTVKRVFEPPPKRQRTFGLWSRMSNFLGLRPPQRASHDRSNHKDDGILLTAWDFAGQIQYHDIHQLFFSPGCLYVLVLDLRLDPQRESPAQSEAAMLRDALRWLNAIVSSAGTDNEVLFVGTHAEPLGAHFAAARLKKYVDWIESRCAPCKAREDMIRKAPQIIVDNKSGLGIESARSVILECASHVVQKKTENIPLRWLRLLELLTGEDLADGELCLELKDVVQKARTVGFSDRREVVAALSHLDNIGEVIYKTKPGLDEWIFPRPFLLLDVMKVLVKDPDKKGLLCFSENEALESTGYLPNHSLAELWSKFRHQNQLRNILNIFGLLMDVQDGVIVPSYLPARSNVEYPRRESEQSIKVVGCLSPHFPAGASTFLLSGLHRCFGDKNQSISLLSQTSSFLRLNTLSFVGNNESCNDIELRSLVSFDSQSHSISVEVGATPGTLRRCDIVENFLVAACQTIIRWLHQQIEQQYPSIAVSWRVKTAAPRNGCGGEIHEWKIAPGVMDVWSHTCCHANELSLYDSIRRTIRDEQTGETLEKIGEDLNTAWIRDHGHEIRAGLISHHKIPDPSLLWKPCIADGPYVFLCHRGPDTKEDIVRPTDWFLSNVLGVKTFFDDVSPQPGDDMQCSIMEPAYRCTHALVLLSPTFRHSLYCVEELNTFMARRHQHRNIELIPALWNVADVEGYAPALDDIVWFHPHTDQVAKYLTQRLWPFLTRCLNKEDTVSTSQHVLRSHLLRYLQQRQHQGYSLPVSLKSLESDTSL